MQGIYADLKLKDETETTGHGRVAPYYRGNWTESVNYSSQVDLSVTL